MAGRSIELSRNAFQPPKEERYLMSLKRLPISIATAAAVALFVAACGGGEETTTVTAPAGGTEASGTAAPARR